MNENSLGTHSVGAQQSDSKRRYLLQLPPALFRARLQAESSLTLLPSAFAPGQLAVRPAKSVRAGQLLLSIDAHAGWFTNELDAQLAGCDLADSLFWREEFVRESLGGRVSARRILAAEPDKYLWPHLHFLPMLSDSPCVPNCVVREDFRKGAHATSISVFAACDLEPFEQELFVRVQFMPWAAAKKHQQSGAQERRKTGDEEAREAKSERGMKRRRHGPEEDAEAEEEEGEEEEEEQGEEGEVGQEGEGPRAQPRPQFVAGTDVTGSDGFGEGDDRNDAFAGDSGKDPSGAQHSEGIGSSDRTHASGTKMLCDVEGLDMIWRNGQAELQLPAGAPGDASKQVPANTRLCLLGSIGGGGGPSLVPAKARPEGYEGPVFEFELNAKSMIVTEDSAKPMKLSQWWADLPNAAGDNAGAVWWHNAALDDDNFTIATVDNPPTIFFEKNSHPMQIAPGFKTLWSLQWDKERKCHMPYQLYVYTSKKCVVNSSSSVCVYHSHSHPAKGPNARKRLRGSQGAPKRRTKRMAGKADDRSGESD